FGDRRIDHLLPKERGIGMVFQSYALYPHMTVAENIGFPLELRRSVSKEERERRVREAAALVQVDAMLDRRPAQLSGGQQDRVALMRDGVLQAYATPTELYARPVNQFVAEFIGTPPMNFFAADLAPRNGSLVARTEGIELALPAGPRGAKAPPTATVGIRPE